MKLDRRMFLRGVLGGTAVTVALPSLEAMAATGAPPKRFIVWFWGNGIRRAHWIPDEVGENWQPKAEMAPLLADPGLRPYLAPVTGYEIKTDTHPHHSGMAGIMTGAKYFLVGPVRDTIVSTFAYPSIDQVVAEFLQQDPANRTPFRSIELGITRFRGTDEGTTFQHLSHNGPNNVNPSEYEPIRVFNRLFGMPSDAQRDGARRSVLDAVLSEITGLKAKVGTRDKTRLDQHFESVRAIELRLAQTAVQCVRPGEPLAEYPDINGNEQIRERNQIMSDLMATAFACDLSRVGSVLFSTAGSGVIFWNVGAQNGFHQICHDERDPGPEQQPTVHAGVTFEMEMLAYFLNRLRSVQEGDGNLLDHSAVFCTTELSEGFVHSNDEFPIIIAGKAGGTLNTGRHVRSSSRENTTKALLTMLRAMGDQRPTFGVDAGQVSDPISELLV